MRGVWLATLPSVPAADLVAAALVAALLLCRLGRHRVHRRPGGGAALLFLLLSNPSFTRLGGVRRPRAVRDVHRARGHGRASFCWRQPRQARELAGARCGRVLCSGSRSSSSTTPASTLAARRSSRCLALAAADGSRRSPATGAPASLVVPVAAAGALLPPAARCGDLYDATITYNVHYSGETYAGPVHGVGVSADVPDRTRAVDALWTVGGAGCLLLVPLCSRKRERLVCRRPGSRPRACRSRSTAAGPAAVSSCRRDPALALARPAWSRRRRWYAARPDASTLGLAVLRDGGRRLAA